ncbi:hypothetical protein HYFRA_00001189 [Hymenoscyphus fraxineus]|uniref:Uncharacterized protein n=1 Tax=Hymenoscyphus fraxineus TaxID=746836 RepID=A0A9N9KUV4_9HELO|nr:hypothetical protein HYFRA_00001189 [Hymenoscyphus fraxineus]
MPKSNTVHQCTSSPRGDGPTLEKSRGREQQLSHEPAHQGFNLDVLRIRVLTFYSAELPVRLRTRASPGSTKVQGGQNSSKIRPKIRTGSGLRVRVRHPGGHASLGPESGAGAGAVSLATITVQHRASDACLSLALDVMAASSLSEKNVSSRYGASLSFLQPASRNDWNWR